MSTTMLYRPADAPNDQVWGMNVEHQVFATDDVDAALKDGWFRHPNDIGEDAKPAKRTKAPKEG